VLVSLVAACASVAPSRPRFVAVFEQRSEFCRIQILQDTRSSACFIAFRCSRQPVSVLAVDGTVCVP
jgi:hypothetical protein